MTAALLDTATTGAYLQRRGVLPAGPVTVRELAGGVSNVVLLAECGGRRVVLKQALDRLRVADTWLADQARAQAEAAALRLLGTLTPDDVPGVLDDDSQRHTLTIAAAPESWVTWKDRLLAGEVDAGVAAWLGDVLRRWHAGTRDRPLPAELESVDGIRQLRIDPFFGTAARRRPHLAGPLRNTAAALLARRTCLVSGDYSPKNVLVGPDGGWVVDLEVAHRGDAAFDVAFLACHLMLKATHLPRHVAALRRCLAAFLTGYGDEAGVRDGAHLCAVTGCLLLARVVGSSPAPYLSPAEASRVERGAAHVLRTRPDDLDAVWRAVVDR